jgi:hypothetical protein
MKRLGPGIYADGEGGMHLDIAELLAVNGYADTPANRETLIAAARAAHGNVTITAAPLAVFTEEWSRSMRDEEDEEVCAMDETKGPLIVRAKRGAPAVRLAIRRHDQLVYVTYARTEERDPHNRPIYR